MYCNGSTDVPSGYAFARDCMQAQHTGHHPTPALRVRGPRLWRHDRPAPLRRLRHGALLQHRLQPCTLAGAQGRVPPPAGRQGGSGSGGTGWRGAAADSHGRNTLVTYHCILISHACHAFWADP